MDDRAFDQVAKDLAQGLSRRRLLGRLLTVAGGAALAPVAPGARLDRLRFWVSSASAQTVTPDLGIAPIASRVSVEGGDDFETNFGDPFAPNTKPFLAHAIVEDQKAFPKSWVRVHNEEGVWGTQHLWLSVSPIVVDPRVKIVDRGDYAKYNLIAPGGDARYQIQFAAQSTSQIRFRVDAATREAVALSIFQNAVHAGLIVAGLLFPNDADIAVALADAIIDKNMDELDTFQPCASAIAGVLNGSSSQSAFLGDCQACLQSPLWVVTVDGLLAKLSAQSWFTIALKQIGRALPYVREVLLALDVKDYLVDLWNLYQAAVAHSPGAMANTLWFIGFNGQPPPVPNPDPTIIIPGKPTSGAPRVLIPGGLWIAPQDAAKASGSSLTFSAQAYPTDKGDPAIDRVEFTAWWPGLLTGDGRWKTACIASAPSGRDHFSCAADMIRLGVPPGELSISFDVYDKSGNRNLAPNGIRMISWAPANAPKITAGPDVVNPGQTTATITWATDQKADSTVEYGTTTSLGQVVSSHHNVIHHSLTLNNLTSGTTYHYRVRSTNGNGEAATKRDRTFTTLACSHGPSLCSGNCIDRNSDPNNCGECGQTCADGQVCAGGGCGCGDGGYACGPICCERYAPCHVVGNSYACGQACVPGTISCNGACIDPLTDQNNCGDCKVVCESNTCQSGVCTAPIPATCILGDPCSVDADCCGAGLACKYRPDGNSHCVQLCQTDGDCTTNDPCVVGYCGPQSDCLFNPTLGCRGACSQEQTPCTGDSDCCAGLVCKSQVCAPCSNNAECGAP